MASGVELKPVNVGDARIEARPAASRLQQVKRRIYGAALRFGMMDGVAGSAWRKRRLSILCYHGVSIHDEHEWRPGLYVRPSFFEHRLRLLREGGYTVLGLQDAMDRMVANSLPPKAVVLTFDDGTFDFYSVAWPILRRFGYPATVYWSTYYAMRQFPVFSVAREYAAWKAGKLPSSIEPSLEGANGAVKDEWLRSECQRLGVDYKVFADQRVLTIMRPDEVSHIAAEGCDIQLHTHRHRMPLEEADFRSEIAENRAIIESVVGRTPTHFCYTSGRFRRLYKPWLLAEGVATATTTEPGVASAAMDPFFLPRLVDHEGLDDSEFIAWVSGLAQSLPRRVYWKDPG